MNARVSRGEPEFNPPAPLSHGKHAPQPNRPDGIAQRAFQKWTARGQPTGTGVADWLEAEEELRQLLVLTSRVQELERRLTDKLSEIKQARRQLMAEHAVAHILSMAVTLTQAAPSLLRCICERLQYGLGALWLVDRAASVLRCAEVVELAGVDVDANPTATLGQALAFGEGLPGRVWAGQLAPSTINVTEPSSSRAAVGATTMCEHNAIAFPIRDGAEFLGVMEFVSRDMRAEDDAVLAMMVGIGRQISQFTERCLAESSLRAEHEERRVAGHIQQRLLPHKNPVLAGYDISGRCISAFDVGGDCFDFIPMTVNCDECLGILVADASGHGIGAALFVAETRAYIRALAMTCPDVHRLLSLVNQRIAEAPECAGFVTAFLVRLEPCSGTVAYANAGHWPGIVFDRLGRVRENMNATGTPLGIDRTAEFSAEFESLEPGELILLFSDGAIEATSPSGELFGLRRLLGTIQAHWSESADQILDAVFDEVIDFYDGRPLHDDITAVVIGRTSRNTLVAF